MEQKLKKKQDQEYEKKLHDKLNSIDDKSKIRDEKLEKQMKQSNQLLESSLTKLMQSTIAQNMKSLGKKVKMAKGSKKQKEDKSEERSRSAKGGDDKDKKKKKKEKEEVVAATALNVVKAVDKFKKSKTKRDKVIKQQEEKDTSQMPHILSEEIEANNKK